MLMSTSNFFLLLGAFLLQSEMVCSATPLSNYTDQAALLAFKSALGPPNPLTNNWTASTNFCNWLGVSCSSQRQRVTALSLSQMNLSGTISPYMGNLSFLEILDLSNNQFYGHLTSELGRLGRLQVLILETNQLQGEIPASLYLCQSLQVISLASNNFTGLIPKELGYLPKLRTLYLSSNNLAAPLPSTLSNISTLQYLKLAQIGLTGPIPPIIFNISSLLLLNLAQNSLTGSIPDNFCHYFPQLQHLRLALNQFSGQLPSTISQCTELIELIIPYNKFEGNVPAELGSMSNLQVLMLGNNSFTGFIPPSLSNISGLEILWLGTNHLQGEIPQELALLSNLTQFLFDFNLLHGPIPPRIFNISSMQVINLSFNSLSLNLSSTADFHMPNLQRLYMNGNQISGSIPYSLWNTSNLIAVDLGFNQLTGQIPTSFGNQETLRFLHLDNNTLTGEGEDLELSFITAVTNCRYLVRLILDSNPLNGVLPNSMGNFSGSLQIFSAVNCQLKGPIPSRIGLLKNLNMLDLTNNQINGTIPTTIGGLENLQRFHLDGNKIQGALPNELCGMQSLGEISINSNMLSGSIPSCISNLTSLQKLYLSSNKLTSFIPLGLWSLENLLLLNLSFNSLAGNLTVEMKISRVLENIDVSWNQISGTIPSIVGSFKSLNSLNLSNNAFLGSIPPSLGDMAALDYLDLSHNNLSGSIPMSLQALSQLKYFNLSFNKLSGEIPTRGPFSKFTWQSYMGNAALCSPSIIGVPHCDTHGSGKSRSAKVLLRYILPPVVFVVIISIVFIILMRKRWYTKTENLGSVGSFSAKEHRTISYHELCQATDNFCEGNLLGAGSFGSVYKGLLSDGTKIAVKILNLQKEGAFKSFDAECRVLRAVRHRNLVKVITTCSHPQLRALVLEYMPNGSLDNWLYSHNYCLSLIQRTSIMVDVASALEYLHHGHSEPIVHCDLKPSNIFLDNEKIAHLGDFGIAKILADNKSSTNTKTLGTFGYMAPEYGSEGRVSLKGDVYSFGITLLETFTRKKPTDEVFSEVLSLRQWVALNYEKNIMKVVDDGLFTMEGDGQGKNMDSILFAILEIGLACTQDSPDERNDIKEVVAKLNKIKLELISCEGV